MNVDFPLADEIDTRCLKTVDGTEEPEGLQTRCKNNSVTYFETVDGTRLYVCRDHALEVFRFASDSRTSDELPDSLDALRDLAADEGISATNLSREELVRRLLSPRDPATVDDHPTVVYCGTCEKLTLKSDTTLMSGHCRGCIDGDTELPAGDYAVTKTE